MGCLLALLAWASPRFVMVLLWLFSDRLTIAFDSFWMGLAGFILVPYTTVFYALAYAPIGGVSGIGWLLVAFGVMLDLGSWAKAGGEANNRMFSE